MRSIEIPQPEDRDWRYRLLEILPGALTWIILSLPLILGLISPALAAYFVIAYLLLWFIRAIALNLRMLQGWQTMNQHRGVAWSVLNQDLENLEVRADNAPKWHARNLARVKKYMGSKRIRPSQLYHLVMIATYEKGNFGDCLREPRRRPI
jgi:hypothetical protein